MNLQETKYYFEKLFVEYWVETHVHFAGVEFDGSKYDAWVNPVYKPLRSRNNGISGTSTVDMGQLYIVCWANSDIEAMNLADVVITFMNEKTDKGKVRSRGYEIIDHGWDESNKVFVMLSFTYEQLSGTC